MLLFEGLGADFFSGVSTQQCNPHSRDPPPPRYPTEPEPFQWGSGPKRITRHVSVDGALD